MVTGASQSVVIDVVMWLFSGQSNCGYAVLDQLNYEKKQLITKASQKSQVHLLTKNSFFPVVKNFCVFFCW